MKTIVLFALYLGFAIAATNLNTTKSAYEVGEPLAGAWQVTTLSDDIIGVFFAGDCTTTNDCFLKSVIPDTETGTFQTSGIFVNGTFDVRYISGGQIAASTTITIQSTITISSKNSFVAGEVLRINYVTSPFHSLYDWIGVFVQGTPDDQYLTYSYVPEGSSGFILLTNPFSTASNIEFRYFFENSQLVTSISKSITDQSGTCSSGCTNPGAACTISTEAAACGSCTTGGCDLTLPPNFLDPLPESTTISPGFSKSLVISMDDNGTIFATGVPANANFTVTTSGGFTNGTFTWSPAVSDENSLISLCFYGQSQTSGLTTSIYCLSVKVHGASCSAYGDPHFTTFDGYNYDFQGVGDFTFAAMSDFSENFRAQARFAPCSQGASVTCIVGFALQDGPIIMTSYFYPDTDRQIFVGGRTISVGDVPVTDNITGVVFTPDGFSVVGVTFPSGIQITLAGFANSDVQMILPAKTYSGNIVGLCGAYTGSSGVDIRARNGTLIDPFTEVGFDILQLDWRVSANDSLFNYTMTGLSYNEVNVNVTAGAFTAQFSSPELDKAAHDLCQHFLTDPDLIRNCLFDIAVSNSLSAARDIIGSALLECVQSGNAGCDLNAKCVNSCNFQGSCDNNGVCHCFPGFSGTTCQTVVPLPVAGMAAKHLPVVFGVVLALFLVILM